ncbi:DUF2637 domain-containing protein [Kineosporia sp. A_224]|uniref:DUF2637 domain-containing protein n=1 Tax=Kineosporia sp. A_224 TaxID=1962180 RepID=UPI0013047193|nr:DUF2637 domain-containing protein [Kineosporia sp. A_224]
MSGAATVSAPGGGRKDPLTVAAVILAVVAFVGSFDHVRTVVATHGQPGWLAWAIALMPEVSVTLAVLKIRRAKRTGEPTAWAWVVGGSAAVFTLAANLATAEATTWGYVVAAWPAWASISAAGLIEMRPTGPAGQVTGQTGGQRAKRDRSPVTAATGQGAVTAPQAVRPSAVKSPVVPGQVPARGRSAEDVPEAAVDVSDLLVVGQAVAADLHRIGQRLTRAALQSGVRDRGHTCSTARAQALLSAVRDLDLSA